MQTEVFFFKLEDLDVTDDVKIQASTYGGTWRMYLYCEAAYSNRRVPTMAA